MRLYCGRLGDRNIVQFMLLVGSFVGFLVVGFIAEGLGRKTASLFAQTSGILGLART